MHVDVEVVNPRICLDCPNFEIEQTKVYTYNFNYHSSLKCIHIDICKYVAKQYEERGFLK